MSSAEANANVQEDATSSGEQLSKNAAKRLAKQQAAAAAKDAKAAKNATVASTTSKKKEAEEEITDPDAYFQHRCQELETIKENGNILYPHKFHAHFSIPQVVAQFGAVPIANGERLTTEVSVAGRVYSKRASGSSLYFYDLQADGGKVQIVADKKSDTTNFAIHQHIKRGMFSTQYSLLNHHACLGVSCYPMII